MAVLGQLANSAEPVSCLELSRELGLEKTKVNRILKTLSHMGMAYRTSSRRYAPGSGMHVLAAQSLSASGLFKVSLPHLESLDSLCYLIALGVLWRDKVSYLFHHAPGTPFVEGIGRTRLFPATRSSLGLILLAQQDDVQIRELYSRNVPVEGFDSVDSLLEGICEIRRQGYATARHNGTLSVAVKIGSPAYAAIGLSGAMKTKDDIRVCLEALREKAMMIEKDMKSLN